MVRLRGAPLRALTFVLVVLGLGIATAAAASADPTVEAPAAEAYDDSGMGMAVDEEEMDASTRDMLAKLLKRIESGIDPPDWVPSRNGQASLANGVIKLSKSLTTPECRSQLNETCFGRCLEAMRVSQLGPVHNLTSIVENPTSPFFPPRSDKKMPCDCRTGLGLFNASSRQAMWVFPGQFDRSPPRLLNVSASHDGKGGLVVRHMGLGGRSCPLIYDVTEGVVMGLRAGDSSGPRHVSEWPVWATVLLALAGVLLLSGIAFVVIKTRSGPPSSWRRTKSSHRGRGGGAGAKRQGKSGKQGEVASLRDPLLHEAEDGKAGGYDDGET